MKKTAILILVLVVSLCGHPLLAHFANGKRAEGFRAVELVQASPEPVAEDTLLREIADQERAGMDALKAGDLKAFGILLADDALFIDSHGLASKAEVLTNVADFRILDYTMDDLRLVRVSETAGLLAYKLTEHGASHGREFSATVYVATLYAKRDGKWVSLFSQETGAKQPAQPQTAKPPGR